MTMVTVGYGDITP